MNANIFSLPGQRREARAFEISSVISIMLHSLILGAFGWAMPLTISKTPENASVSIDLEMLAAPVTAAYEPPAEPEAPPLPEPQAVAEPEPAPMPKKVETPRPEPKKMEARKPKPAPARPVAKKGDAPEKLVASKSMEPAARPAPAPARAPAQLGGAHSPHPPYPDLARKRGQEGTVNVRCEVDAQGKVTAVSLAKSSGFKLLDEAALKAVGKWKFRPGEKDGASVAGSVIVPVQFKLK